MRRLKLTLKIVLGLLGVAALLLGCGIVWLCYTQAGLQFALNQLNHVPRMQLQVSGVRGRLAGPLHIEHVLLDHDHVRIDVTSLDVELTPALLMSGLIAVDRAHLGKAVVTYKIPQRITPDKPIHFLPPFLRMHVDELLIDAGEYHHTNGYVLQLTHGQGELAVTRHRLTAETFDVRTTDFDVQGNATLRSTQVLTLSGQGNALYRVPNGVQLKGQVSAQGPVTGSTRYLDLQAKLHAPHNIAATGKLTYPNNNWLLEGDAQAEQLLLDAWWQEPAFHFANASMHFRLDTQGMRYVGDAQVPQWSPARLHLDADTVYAKKVFTLRRAEVSVPASGVTSTTTGNITFISGKPTLDLHSQWRALRWPLHARLDDALVHSPKGRLELQGAGPYTWQLDAGVSRQQWPGGQLQAQGQLHTASPSHPVSELKFQRYTLTGQQGEASGDGWLKLKRPYEFGFNVRASRLDPGHWLADWPGRIDALATLQGRVYATRTQPQWLDANITQLNGTLRKLALHGSGHVQVRSQGRERDWQADNLRLQWGSNTLQANGRIDTRGQHRNNVVTQRLNITLQAPKLDEWQLGFSGDVRASAEFSAHHDDVQLAVTASASRIGYRGFAAAALNASAELHSDAQAPLRVNVSASQLAAGPVLWQAVQLAGSGSLQQHTFTLDAMPIADVLPEKVRMHLALAGSYDAPRWQGTLQDWQMTDAGQTDIMHLEQPVALQWSPDDMQLGQLCILSMDRGETGRGCFNARAARNSQQQRQWEAHVQLDNLPVSLRSNKYAPGARLVGRLFGAADFSADAGKPWQGAAHTTLARGALLYQVNGRNKTLPLRQAGITLNADATSLSGDAELRIGEQTVSTFSATLARSNQPLMQWPLTGVVSLSSSDAQLIPVFFADVDRARGTLAGILQASGTLNKPLVAGNLKLLQGELDFYQTNLALRQMYLDANLGANDAGQHLTFAAQSATGVKGDQGQLQAKGEFTWRVDDLAGTLRLQGERLLVADLPEYHVLATPDLNFVIRNRNINVSGEVLIPEARLQPKSVVGAVQKSIDARLVNEQTLPDSQQWKVRSQITVRMGEAVNFDGFGLQGKLGGAVTTLMQSNQTASGTGELAINEGRYEAYSQKLDIKRGRLIYNDTALGDPGLDIQAERAIADPTLGDITVGVYVRGVLHAPRLQFYSDPAMNQTQIVSYLLVGKPLDSLQGQEATSVRSASNTLALQGGGYLAGQLGRKIGLEEVGVETDSNNQSSLVLGKFLSPRLFVSYGISLTEALNTFKLRYILGKNWQIKTEAGQAKSADLEFKIEH